jgi:hypothetical protein
MNNQPKGPIILDIDPGTLLLILVALLLVPLLLTGILVH